MAKHTLFVVPGTWELQPGQAPDAPTGLLAPYATRLDPAVWDVKFVDYPATFGPIPNERDPLEFLGAPSYVDSRDQGVAEVKRLINETPGTFAVAGFSQGGAVADLVVRALVEGDMRHRHSDCLWAHVFASPHRAKGKSFHLDDPNRLKFEGVAGDPVTNTYGIDYFAYAHEYDMFTNADIDNTYGVEIYEAIKNDTAFDPQGKFTAFDSVLKVMNIVSSYSDGPAEFAKVLNTVTAVANFALYNGHGRYADPGYAIFNGMTALDHSINHLNYWGPRR